MDADFRMVFLFPEESCHGFIEEFSECQPRMLKFLTKLEGNAVKLDQMNKGAKISSMAGSSVGAAGSVFSIVGLALIPFTAGVSLALTMTGVGMGITSGVISLVTTTTEVGVNHIHQKKAGEVLQSFMEDMTKIKDCLEEVSRQTISKLEESNLDSAVGVGKASSKAVAVGRGIDSVFDAVSAAKLLKSKDLISRFGKMMVKDGKALNNIPEVASDIPDVGLAAAEWSFAAFHAATAGFIVLNALFLGMDIFFICTDSVSLAKGNETEVSQFIRARAALWSSEMDSWKKIHDSLCKGLETSGMKKDVLEMLFYQDTEMERQRETEEER